ncbi:MAG: ABC transporter substrate-binding protein [Chloroflexi bacterium]|nr:ABC transporter substrate-binding protein [Chloroflexota bacterium]
MAELQGWQRRVGRSWKEGRCRTASKSVGLLVAVALLVFSGCAKPVGTTTSAITSTSTTATAITSQSTSAVATTAKPATTTAAPKPATPAGPYGELRIALATFGSEKFYPPTTEQGVLVSLLAPMYDFLFRIRGTEITPGVVDKWELAPDALSWTYSLHRGIKFHNGEDLDAQDVKFTLDRMTAQDAVSSELRDSIARVEVVDNYTIRVFTKGAALDLPLFSAPIPPSRGQVLPKDYIEKNGVDYFATRPIGSGPFKFVNRVQGDSVEYEAMSSHWMQTPAFKKLTLLLIPEETTRVAALKSGELDVIDVGPEKALDMKALGYTTFATQWTTAMVEFHGTYPPVGATVPTGNVKVRQALSLAINRDEVIKSFFAGVALPAGPPMQSEESRDIDTAYWMNYARTVLNVYDPEKAKQLLKDAGYPGGLDIKLWTFTMSGGTYLPQLATVIQAYWSKIGVRAQIVPIDWGSFQKIQRLRPVVAPELIGQASTIRQDAGPLTRKNLANVFHSNGNERLFGNTNPGLDKVLDDVAAEGNPSRRKQLFEQAMKMVADTYLDLMVARVPSQGALGPRVSIDYPQPAGYSFTLYADIAKHK